jgi:hypothetical protein
VSVVTTTVLITVSTTINAISCLGTACYIASDTIQSWFWTAIVSPALVLMVPILILIAWRIRSEVLYLGILALISLLMAKLSIVPPFFSLLALIFAAGAVTFIVNRFLSGGKGESPT